MNNDNNLKLKQESLFTEEKVPTVEQSSRKEAHRFNCRINKIDTINRIYAISTKFDIPRNIVFNQILELGLPILERRYNIYSGTEEQNIINQKDSIIEDQKKVIEFQNKQINELTKMLEENLKALNKQLLEINASTSIQEYINSSTYEHLKFLLKIFIATQGACALSEELSNQYDNRVASQFEDRKNTALSNYYLKKSKFYNEFLKEKSTNDN